MLKRSLIFAVGVLLGLLIAFPNFYLKIERVIPYGSNDLATYKVDLTKETEVAWWILTPLAVVKVQHFIAVVVMMAMALAAFLLLARISKNVFFQLKKNIFQAEIKKRNKFYTAMCKMICYFCHLLYSLGLETDKTRDVWTSTSWVLQASRIVERRS